MALFHFVQIQSQCVVKTATHVDFSLWKVSWPDVYKWASLQLLRLPTLWRAADARWIACAAPQNQASPWPDSFAVFPCKSDFSNGWLVDEPAILLPIWRHTGWMRIRSHIWPSAFLAFLQYVQTELYCTCYTGLPSGLDSGVVVVGAVVRDPLLHNSLLPHFAFKEKKQFWWVRWWQNVALFASWSFKGESIIMHVKAL